MVGHTMSWLVMALVLIVSACGDTPDTSDDSVMSSTTRFESSSEGGTVGDTDNLGDTVNLGDPAVPIEAPETTTSTSATPPPEIDPEEGDPAPGDPAPGDPEEPDPDDSVGNPSTPPTAQPDAAIPPGLGSLVATARSDLAALLSVAETEIVVSVAEFVVWPDAGLGCPEPGMAYTQIQVDGWRTVLNHANTSYAYHGGGSRPDPFLCRNPSFPVG